VEQGGNMNIQKQVYDVGPNNVRELFYANDQTGELFWRERTDDVEPNRRARNVFNKMYAGRKVGYERAGHGTTYLQVRAIGKVYALHRVVWLYCYLSWPKGQIDHVDGNGLNNHISNLRDVTRSQNQRNAKRRKDNKSGFTGVTWNSKANKWLVRICTDSGRKHLGYFFCLKKAILVRDVANMKNDYHPNHGREK